MADQPPFQPEFISVSYVILADVQGQIRINVEGDRLSRVFGNTMGRGNVVAVPGGAGFVVQMGPANLFQVIGNRIEFKGATPEILYELYRNARAVAMVPPYNARVAVAFGVNVEANYVFPGITRDQLLARMRPTSFRPSVSLEGMRLKQTFGIQTNVLNASVEKSNTDPNAVFFNFNNHIPRPNLQSYSLEQLTQEVTQVVTIADEFAEEVYQCGQNPV